MSTLRVSVFSQAPNGRSPSHDVRALSAKAFTNTSCTTDSTSHSETRVARTWRATSSA